MAPNPSQPVENPFGLQAFIHQADEVAMGTLIILLVMSLIDVVAGFTMSITSATRDMSMAGH